MGILNSKRIMLVGLKGATGSKIVSTELIGQDENGGNIYQQTFDDGSTSTFTVPNGGGGGSNITVDTELSTESENPVQNKVITEALESKLSKMTGTWDNIYAYIGGSSGVGGVNKLVKVDAGNGLSILSNGYITVSGAPNAEIDKKSSGRKPITPYYLDYAVKVGITTNKEVLTEEEQQKAKDWLGINAGLKTETITFEFWEFVQGLKSIDGINKIANIVSLEVSVVLVDDNENTYSGSMTIPCIKSNANGIYNFGALKIIPDLTQPTKYFSWWFDIDWNGSSFVSTAQFPKYHDGDTVIESNGALGGTMVTVKLLTY